MLGAVSNTATRPEFGGDDGGDASTLWAYCVSPGRAFLRQGSANNKIQIAPGTLLQKIATSDGNDATIVPFTFAGTEEFTLTNGDATNPRVDLLQMKLEYVTDTTLALDLQDAVTRALTTPTFSNTRRRVRCTLTVKSGTPAASPVIPDPDAGFVPVGTVVVGHNWVTGGNAPIFGVDTAESTNAVVHDQRMPIRVSARGVDPVQFKLETAWALSNVNQFVTASSGTNKMFAICPAGLGRLIGVDVHTSAGSLSATLGVMQPDLSSAPSAVYKAANVYNINTSVTLDGANYLRCSRIFFEGSQQPVAGPTIQPSIVNAYGVPLWTSGYRVPLQPRGEPAREALTMAVINQTNATKLAGVAFLVAW